MHTAIFRIHLNFQMTLFKAKSLNLVYLHVYVCMCMCVFIYVCGIFVYIFIYLLINKYVYISKYWDLAINLLLFFSPKFWVYRIFYSHTSHHNHPAGFPSPRLVTSLLLMSSDLMLVITSARL